MNYEHQQHLHAGALYDDGGGSSFCKGGAMTMYMTGFSFSLFNPNKGCLNLFFSDFTLDSTFKFLLAMVVVTCLGISVEGVSSMKRRYVSGFKKRRNAAMVVSNTNNRDFDGKAKYVLAGFQGLQALIGYILMLSAMTFSIELLFSAVLGLSLGCLVFEKHKIVLGTEGGGNVTSDDGDGTPCCGYIEDEDGNVGSHDEFGYQQSPSAEESSSLILRSAVQERN